MGKSNIIKREKEIVELSRSKETNQTVICHLFRVEGLLIGFQDVAFLPPELVFLHHIKKNCGKGECLWTTTCLKSVVCDKHGHAPCKHSSKPFFVSINFYGSHGTYKLTFLWMTLSFGDIVEVMGLIS